MVLVCGIGTASESRCTVALGLVGRRPIVVPQAIAPKGVTVANTTTAAQGAAQTPYEFTWEWTSALRNKETPLSAKELIETLAEGARGIHALNEFVTSPISAYLEKIVLDTSSEWNSNPAGLKPISEDKRPFDYADVGRLIELSDEIRQDLGTLLRDVQEIALLAHEDIVNIAKGYGSDCESVQPGLWKDSLVRFHGLDLVA
jgi:hypothetical protein